MKLMLGILNEYEGDGTLWFEITDRDQIISYIENNIDRDETREFILKEMTDEEAQALADQDQ